MVQGPNSEINERIADESRSFVPLALLLLSLRRCQNVLLLVLAFAILPPSVAHAWPSAIEIAFGADRRVSRIGQLLPLRNNVTIPGLSNFIVVFVEDAALHHDRNLLGGIQKVVNCGLIYFQSSIKISKIDTWECSVCRLTKENYRIAERVFPDIDRIVVKAADIAVKLFGRSHMIEKRGRFPDVSKHDADAVIGVFDEWTGPFYAAGSYERLTPPFESRIGIVGLPFSLNGLVLSSEIRAPGEQSSASSGSKSKERNQDRGAPILRFVALMAAIVGWPTIVGYMYTERVWFALFAIGGLCAIFGTGGFIFLTLAS